MGVDGMVGNSKDSVKVWVDVVEDAVEPLKVVEDESPYMEFLRAYHTHHCLDDHNFPQCCYENVQSTVLIVWLKSFRIYTHSIQEEDDKQYNVKNSFTDKARVEGFTQMLNSMADKHQGYIPLSHNTIIGIWKHLDSPITAFTKLNV